jgi:hypothetical protein
MPLSIESLRSFIINKCLYLVEILILCHSKSSKFQFWKESKTYYLHTNLPETFDIYVGFINSRLFIFKLENKSTICIKHNTVKPIITWVHLFSYDWFKKDTMMKRPVCITFICWWSQRKDWKKTWNVTSLLNLA